MADEKKKPRTSAAVKNRYNEKAYDRINLVVPKGYKDKIKEAAEQTDNGSVNGFIKRLIDKELENMKQQ